MGMVEIKSCELYECCIYRNFAGSCHSSCINKLDTVLVVRCKDCKHYTEGMAVGMCKRDPQKPIMPMPYNNYCGFAERKGNE